MHAVCLSLVLLSAAPDEIDASVVVLAEGRVVPAAGWSIRGDGELVVAAPASSLARSPTGGDGMLTPSPRDGPAGVCNSIGPAITLVRFAGLTARAGARRIVVPATGLARITLTTDFGARSELGDCVNWCELLLVEKNKEATNEK